MAKDQRQHREGDSDRHEDDRPARAKRSLVSPIVWIVSILVVLAGLLFVGYIVAIALVQGDPVG